MIYNFKQHIHFYMRYDIIKLYAYSVCVCVNYTSSTSKVLGFCWKLPCDKSSSALDALRQCGHAIINNLKY